jgi:hypothetical protein
MHALDYRWWWLVDTGFAIGSLSKNQQSHLSAFMGGTGIRFNILQHDFRPHLGLLVHYVQFFGEATRFLPLDLGWPIFVGLKLYGGLEYFFGSEMSALVEGAYGNYININEPFRHIYFASASLALYF